MTLGSRFGTAIVFAYLASVMAPAAADDGAQLRRLVEAQLLRGEKERQFLHKKKSQLVVKLLSLIAEKPAAAAYVGITAGSAGWASDPSLSEDSKAVLAGVAVVGAIACLLDADCRAFAVKLAELSSEADHLQEKIGSITRDVGHRVYVHNRCNRPVTFGLMYVGLEKAWQTGAWWTFTPNQGRYLTFGQDAMPLRATNDQFYYYAETTDNQGKLRWSGTQQIGIGNQSYQAVGVKMPLDDDLDYVLALGCK